MKLGMVKCKECGAEISSKAKVCPHCGFDTRSRLILFVRALGIWWGRRSYLSRIFIRFGIGTCFLVFIFALGSLSGGEESTSKPSSSQLSTKTASQTTAPEPKILDISYFEFDSLFGLGGSLTDIQKEEVFKRDYKGRYVQWKCELVDISEETFGDDYIMTMKCDPRSFTHDLLVYLREDQKDKALYLEKGSYVEFVASLTRYGGLLSHAARDGVIVS